MKVIKTYKTIFYLMFISSLLGAISYFSWLYDWDIISKLIEDEVFQKNLTIEQEVSLIISHPYNIFVSFTSILWQLFMLFSFVFVVHDKNQTKTKIKKITILVVFYFTLSNVYSSFKNEAYNERYGIGIPLIGP